MVRFSSIPMGIHNARVKCRIAKMLQFADLCGFSLGTSELEIEGMWKTATRAFNFYNFCTIYVIVDVTPPPLEVSDGQMKWMLPGPLAGAVEVF